MMVARRTPGPAYANLQGRKPRDVGRGSASDAMGISMLAVCCRGALKSDRAGDDPGRAIATGRIGIAQRRWNDTTAIQGGAMASLVIAGRESAKQKDRTGASPGIDSDHDVSILITAEAAAGR